MLLNKVKSFNRVVTIFFELQEVHTMEAVICNLLAIVLIYFF